MTKHLSSEENRQEPAALTRAVDEPWAGPGAARPLSGHTEGSPRECYEHGMARQSGRGEGVCTAGLVGWCLFRRGLFHWPSGRLEIHITQQQDLFSDRLHWSRALILPHPQGRMVYACLREETAAPAGRVRGSLPCTPAPSDASTHVELLKGEAAVQTSNCKKCLDLSLVAGTGSRPACKCVPRWRTSCSGWLNCRRR